MLPEMAEEEPKPKESNKDSKPQDPTPISPHPAPEGRTNHKANCHCGAVRFTVTLPAPFPSYKMNKCNCSICTKNGYLLVYPARKDVVWLRGYDTMTTYYCAQKKKPHMFCGVCGTSVLIDFKLNEEGETDPEKDLLAINARTFADLDLDNDELEWTTFDGRALLQPQYSIDS